MQPVVRALRVVRAVGQRAGGLTLQELSEELGIPMSSMHRLLAVLTQEGFLARTPRDRRYVLGAVMQTMPRSASREYLRKIAEPRLDRLSKDTGETAFLTEMIGDRVVCVALSEGTRSLRLFVRLGQEMPLHAAASARMLLAQYAKDEIAALLGDQPLQMFTFRTLRSVDEVIAHLELTRVRGYDISEDELDNHAWAVAAPIREGTGAIRASLAIAAPSLNVVEPGRKERLIRMVLGTTAEISAELGYQPDGQAGTSATQ